MNIDELTSFCTTLLHGDLEHGLFFIRRSVDEGFRAQRWAEFSRAAYRGRDRDAIECYISTATHADATPLNRRRETFTGLHFIVLDDVGTKAPIPPAKPTYIVETSAGNFQYGYLLREPIVSWDDARALVSAVYRSGATDSGGNQVSKPVRLPIGRNLKPGRDQWEVRHANV